MDGEAFTVTGEIDAEATQPWLLVPTTDTTSALTKVEIVFNVNGVGTPILILFILKSYNDAPPTV